MLIRKWYHHNVFWTFSVSKGIYSKIFFIFESVSGINGVQKGSEGNTNRGRSCSNSLRPITVLWIQEESGIVLNIISVVALPLSRLNIRFGKLLWHIQTFSFHVSHPYSDSYRLDCRIHRLHLFTPICTKSMPCPESGMFPMCLYKLTNTALFRIV